MIHSNMPQYSEHKKLTATEFNSLMTMAIQQSFNAIVITNACFENNGPHILFCNPAFCEMTGYSEEELLDNRPVSYKGLRQI